MKVVIDTNVLLVSVSQKSPWHPIFLGLLQGQYTLCVTTDIMDEYAEIIEEQMGIDVSQKTLQIIESLPNLERIHKYFFWQLLHKDPDDNKFVDCFVAADANFLVTDDKDFKVLKNITYPSVQVIGKDGFMDLLIVK